MKLPPTFSDGKKSVHAIIETPRGSGNKYSYDPDQDYFELNKVLPAGLVFPVDFGFIPHTLAADGDPLDVMVLMDHAGFPGCVLDARVIGVLKASQKEKGKKEIRNDRIVAVAAESKNYKELDSLDDLPKNLINEWIHFFDSYNELFQKKFKLLGVKNSSEAVRIIRQHQV